MVTIIDLRALLGHNTSGVEVYLTKLLDNILEQNKKDTFILYTNSAHNQKSILSKFKRKNTIIVQTFFPNRIFNLLLIFLRWPKLDKLVYKKTKLKCNTFFVPDLRPCPLSKSINKVSAVHDLSFIHFPKYFSLKTRIWYKILNQKKELLESNKIIAVSNFTKQDIIKTFHISPNKIEVIYEGVNIEKSNIKYQKNIINLPKEYFLFLSTLEPRKNIDNLIKGFLLFKSKEKSDLKLIIAGHKNNKIFKNINTPNNPDIISLGFIQNKQKYNLYKNAKAFIYPSFFEGFGLPLLEAMFCNTPIITSNTSSMPEIVKDAALLIDPSSPEDISKAMNKILEQSTRKKLEVNMKKRITHFSWEKCAKQTLDFIN